jgi:hypothetical protein
MTSLSREKIFNLVSLFQTGAIYHFSLLKIAVERSLDLSIDRSINPLPQ